MKHAKKSYWSKALKHFDSGIINGEKIARDVCWKFGMRFNEGVDAFAF